MDFTQLSIGVVLVLISVLAAEAANGWTDAPAGTSAAVASGLLTSRQALWRTAIFNFVGLTAAIIVGAAVAKTIGTGIVRPEVISVASIGIAMLTITVCAAIAAWLGLPVSKTHLLLSALAGIGYAQGGFDALLPVSGNLADSGWVAVGKGMLYAIFLGWVSSFILARIVIKSGLDERVPDHWWRRFQQFTVCFVASGHGFNDGLKYVGVFTLVLHKSNIISEFHVLPEVIGLCAVVMGLGSLLGGWRIHRRLDAMVNHEHQLGDRKKPFGAYMGVCTELVSGFSIWQSGSLGIPMSTNHAVVSAMAGAKSAKGKAHASSVVKILGGWVATYLVGFSAAENLPEWLL